MEEYFYRVQEYVTTFKHDPGNSEPFCVSVDFKGPDLLKCRGDALAYAEERLEGFQNGNVKFFLPFEGPDNFEFGKNSAYSLVVYFVQLSIDGENAFAIAGESEDEMKEGLELEALVYSEKGLEF